MVWSKSLTISELFEVTFRDHWNQERYIVSGHAKEVTKLYQNKILPHLGHKRIQKLTPVDVKRWHDLFRSTPVPANRALEVLSKLYNFGIENGLNPLGMNPCRAVKPFTERQRQRHSGGEELRKIIAQLEEMKAKYPVQIAFFYALLYSGARPRCLERARHSDLVPLENGNGVLTYEGKHTHRTGIPETVIFHPKIMEIIGKLPRRRDGLIFGIKMPRRIWRTIRDKVNAPDLWARDFRRTFASAGLNVRNEQGERKMSLDIIGELLNHRSTQTTKRYAKLDQGNRIEAVSEIVGKMDALFPGKVS